MAYDSGKDVSKMLEVNRVHLQSGFEEIKGWIVMKTGELQDKKYMSASASKLSKLKENKADCQVIGYCLTTAKGVAEILKLIMALILLPVCRNASTWLRPSRARLFVPFDDNINFHKIIAFSIAIGTLLHTFPV
ncbi:hypothetical protein GIB67_022509 [Kingdonia uniflora]|uniref:Uncharacterized protein n=1 Tax=Kingdonia uniflora TaxID=39325 RepID=A0A7J7L741_9MAGN|nr:hypothetical protein GIB67_022509 [Kingdonia uniflora]